jgi:hypothetical protein
MAYCTITDVRAKNPKQTYDDDSTPTQTQVEQFITDIAVEIDNVLQAQGYTIPVTSPANFVSHLKQVNANGAAALADMAMFPDSPDGTSPYGKQLYEIYQKQLAALRNGEVPAQLGPGSSSSPVASYYTEMGDREDFPALAFRMRSRDLEF